MDAKAHQFLCFQSLVEPLLLLKFLLAFALTEPRRYVANYTKGVIMNFKKETIIISILIIFSFLSAYSQSHSEEKFIKHCIQGTQKLFEIQKKVKDIHPFLYKFHPIVIVENDHFYIFNYDSIKGSYIFSNKQPTPFPLPSGVQASFPVNGIPSCVVTKKIFDSLNGYVTILHEFMHCCQAEICETKLKKKLILGRKGLEENDPMWELNHLFPYENPEFVRTYSKLIEGLDSDNKKIIVECRHQLRKILNKADFEYMVWQEWKEGFARLIENKIQAKLKLDINNYGLKRPYNRVTFYVGGAKIIQYLSLENNESFLNIELLFDKIISL